MNVKLLRWGYVLGMSLILTAIAYFFAANWGGLERNEKLLLSTSLTLLFYIGWFFFQQIHWIHQQFMSKLFLLAGVISFGVSTALIGQIYNSHADSYMLFVIWLIPALLISLVSRYQPLYVLSYVLFHIAVWFYREQVMKWDDMDICFVIFAVVNLLLFAALELGLMRSPILKFMSFVVFHLSMLWLSIVSDWDAWANLLYVLLLAYGFYYLYQVKKHDFFFILQLIVVGIYLFSLFVKLLIHLEVPELFLFFGLVLSAAVIYSGIRLATFLKEKSFYQKIQEPLIVCLTVLSSSVGFICFIGLFALMGGLDFVESANIIFFLSVLTFGIAGWRIRSHRHKIIGNTLLTFGCMVSALVLTFSHSALLAIWLALVGWVIYLVPSRAAHLFLFFAFEGTLYYQFDELGLHWSITLASLIGLNIVIAYYGAVTSKVNLSRSLYQHGFFYGLFFLFLLTFAPWDYPIVGYMVNIIFFVLVTGLIFWLFQRRYLYEFRVIAFFWVLFVVYKYYDLAWKLLHKSISFLLIGAILLGVIRYIDLKWGSKPKGKPTFASKVKIWSIILVIAIQGVITGYQVFDNESTLRNGEQIKLEIVPLDPRSLLQGDYVILNYSISRIEVPDLPDYSEKVRVVLQVNQKGLHEFKQIYREGMDLAEDEVVINGVVVGSERVEYGIENYFVPEGTGLETEQEAKFVYVRVSAKGDAIIERLSPE
jgi:uncharacterized membrane-anchored protein/uncharacterized membrane protein